MNPKHPVYVISKGRWESRLTARALDHMRVPHYLVVEPQEREQYAAVVDKSTLLTLPFSNLGLGSIPARNWVWQHAIEQGAVRHWILDDNIRAFYRLLRNVKNKVADGTIFRVMEDFAERYRNVALTGPNYQFLAKQNQLIPPYVMNTRVYSCILILNELPHRWRGRYNEDTDLSLRALKDGWCTVQFNAFLSAKAATMTMKGGNTEQLYQGDGRLQMAQSLRLQHPDVTRISRKWGRWQHHVDYRGFKGNRLLPAPGVVIAPGVDNYGMVLQ